ncbi:hypothetical protein SUGI_0297790 [Cryptomeria japonica]|nr:hypothetical protein SUGI_0297790 [Cryptomeria japonica]
MLGMAWVALHLEGLQAPLPLLSSAAFFSTGFALLRGIDGWSLLPFGGGPLIGMPPDLPTFLSQGNMFQHWSLGLQGDRFCCRGVRGDGLCMVVVGLSKILVVLCLLQFFGPTLVVLRYDLLSVFSWCWATILLRWRVVFRVAFWESFLGFCSSPFLVC